MGGHGVRVRALTVVQSESPRPSDPTHTITAEAAAAFDLEIEGLSDSEADQDLGAQLQHRSTARCKVSTSDDDATHTHDSAYGSSDDDCVLAQESSKRRNPRPRSKSVGGDLPEHTSSFGSLIEDEIYSRLRRPTSNTRRTTRRTIDDSLSRKTHQSCFWLRESANRSALSKSCSEHSLQSLALSKSQMTSREHSHLHQTCQSTSNVDNTLTLTTLRTARRVLFEPCSLASDIQITRWTDGGGLSTGKWVQCYLAVVGSWSAGQRLLIFANDDADAIAEQDFAFGAFVNCKRFDSELREIHLIGSPGVPSIHFRISNELLASDYAGRLKHQLLTARTTPRVGWGRLPELSTPDVGKVHNAISRKLRRQQMHGGESLLTWATSTVKQLVSNQQVDLAELWEQQGSQGLAQSPCRRLAVELSEYCAEFAQKMYRECGCEQEEGEASELNCWLAQLQLHELRCAVETVILKHCGGMSQLRRWVSFMPRANEMQYENNLRLPIAASVNYPDNCTAAASESLDQQPPQENNNNKNQLSALRVILAEPVAAIHQIADAESVAEVVGLWTVAKQQAFKLLSAAWGEVLEVPDTPRVLEALFCAAQSRTLLIDALLAKLFTPDDVGGFVPDQYVLRAEESGLNGAQAVNWLLRPQWLLTKDISDEAMESFYSCHRRPMETSLLQYRFGGNRLVKAKLKQHLLQAMSTCSCQRCTDWPQRQELTPAERKRVREFCDSWHAELELLDKIRSEKSLQSQRPDVLAFSSPAPGRRALTPVQTISKVITVEDIRKSDQCKFSHLTTL